MLYLVQHQCLAFSNAGPRTVRVALTLHREMMEAINYNSSNLVIEDLDDDYVDTLIKKIQSISVPKYVATTRSVEPPMIAVRFGNEILLKELLMALLMSPMKNQFFTITNMLKLQLDSL